MSIIANIIGYMVMVAIAIIVFAVCVATVRVALDIVLVFINNITKGGKNEKHEAATSDQGDVQE